MNKRNALIAIGAFALIIAGIGWYLASPLFIDETVNEEFPFEADPSAIVATSEESGSPAPQEQQVISDEAEDTAEEDDASQSTNENVSAATAEFDVVSEGQFTGTDSFHEGSGNAIVYQNGTQRILRFDEFSVTNGPDLHVILTKHPAPGSRSEVGEDYIDLGSLKGNIGSQNYDIPADVDLSEYKGVVIYCVPFHVVFATATLNQ